MAASSLGTWALGARAARLTTVLVLAPWLVLGVAGPAGAQEGGPSGGVVPVLPTPSEEPPPSPQPEPEPEPEPSAEPSPAVEPSPEQTRSRATTAPSPRAPSPVASTAEEPTTEPPSEEPASSPLPGATATPFLISPTGSATAEPVAETAQPADPLARLVQLAVGGALLLLVGGVTGLYLTRESRGGPRG